MMHTATVTKKLEDLFSCEKSCFSNEALSIMAAGNLYNYGGSDKATEMINQQKVLFNPDIFRFDFLAIFKLIWI